MAAGSKTFWPLLAVTFFLSACNPCSRADRSPRLTEVEVVAIADALARNEGYDLNQWHKGLAHFEPADPDCTWVVAYDSLGNALPGQFLVQVNDNTKRASLDGGM
jgi:hypothetical protein